MAGMKHRHDIALALVGSLRYLDNQGRPYRQNVVGKTHAQEMCVGMKVTDRTD